MVVVSFDTVDVVFLCCSLRFGDRCGLVCSEVGAEVQCILQQLLLFLLVL